MSGGYTHITIAQLAIEEATHRRDGLLHNDAKMALGFWKKFCIVGAVSPDYPYLDIFDGSSSAWADAMHKGRAVELLRQGVGTIQNIQNDNVRQKCMAWLFGFAAHVTTDGTIHPVVNLKVGPYEDNKTEHRRCEMSQDVYAHKRLNMGLLDFNKQLSTNVDGTSDADNNDLMDRDVANLWGTMLGGVYPEHGVPAIDDWHRAMRRLVKVGESGRYFWFARHVAEKQGLVYPTAPEEQYITNLSVPGNKVMDFEGVLQKSLGNVIEMWGWLASALQGDKSPLDTLDSWSLDTGCTPGGRMVYWSE